MRKSICNTPHVALILISYMIMSLCSNVYSTWVLCVGPTCTQKGIWPNTRGAWTTRTGVRKQPRIQWTKHRRRPGAEFGETWKNFADQDFWMTIFREKISIFTPKISDDLFLVIDHDFPVTYLFQDFPYLCCLWCRIWPLLHKKSPCFRK